MLTDDQIYEAAKLITNSESDHEKSIEISNALRMVYTCAVEDAVEKIKSELRDNEALLVDKEVIVNETPKLIGREPWYMRQTSLEKLFRKKSTILDEEKEEKFKQDVRDSVSGNDDY